MTRRNRPHNIVSRTHRYTTRVSIKFGSASAMTAAALTVQAAVSAWGQLLYGMERLAHHMMSPSSHPGRRFASAGMTRSNWSTIRTKFVGSVVIRHCCSRAQIGMMAGSAATVGRSSRDTRCQALKEDCEPRDGQTLGHLSRHWREMRRENGI